MKKIVVSDEAMAAIRTASHGHLEQTARRVPAGWELPLQDDTFERLEDMRMEGETHSDVIIRAVAFFQSGGRRQ